MYQSAAHAAVPGVADCLGVPLVRRPIRGTASCRDLNYSAQEGDEVEDLYLLLEEVRASYPEVEAVSSGAILSTYQRTRVEDVCTRLQLRSLAYLWQREQRSLLASMTHNNITAVIVKTASMGLEPSVHLGRTIDAELRSEFVTLNDKFGFHECGEGGEYETLVLDSTRFRRRRLVLDEVEKLTLEDAPRGCGAVGVLCIRAWHTEAKSESEQPLEQDETLAKLEIPRRLVTIESEVVDLITWTLGKARRPLLVPPRTSSAASSGLVSTCAATRTGDSVSSCVSLALHSLRVALAADGLGFADCVYAHLYVSEMSKFDEANTAYIEALGALRDVPSRACVGIASPAPAGSCTVCVDLDALAPAKDKRRRQTLNVRSISRWAPVCIGPYCQANVLAGAVVLVAGQIALDPATMQLERANNLNLCLQHNDAILRSTPCNSRLEHVLSYVVYSVDDITFRTAARELQPPVIAVRVPALPVQAHVEVQIVAATIRAAPLFRCVRRDYASAQKVAVVATASIADRSACIAALQLAAGHRLADLIDACLHLLRDVAHLRMEHWARLRVFVRCGHDDPQAVRLEFESALAACVPESTSQQIRGPAFSVIPVVDISSEAEQLWGCRAVAHLLALNLDALEAGLWIRSNESTAHHS